MDGYYVYRPTSLAKMKRRFGIDIPLTVTVRDLEDLIDSGVDINSYEESNVNLLMHMTRKFSGTYFSFKPTHITCYEQVRLLEKLVKCVLENGADPNLVSKCRGLTVLRVAFDGKQSWKMCRMLLSYGADVNAKINNASNATVLAVTYTTDYTVILESHRNCVIHMWQRMFVEAGADAMEVVDCEDELGSAISSRIFSPKRVEDAFMIDFYIENAIQGCG